MKFKFTHKIALALVAVSALSSIAFGASTINPTVPAQNSPLTSAPIRQNFQAAYTDVNSILSKFSSTFAPVNPSTPQDWFNTTTPTSWLWNLWDGAQWVNIGTLNPAAHTWSAAGTGAIGIQTAPLQVNLNASGTMQTAQTGTLFQGQQANGVIARNELDSFGAASIFTGVRADGTKASPTTLQSGEEIASFNSYGYNGAAFVGPRAAFRCYADQVWTTSAAGTHCTIATTPDNSNTLTDVIIIGADGGIQIGAPTGGDKGANTLNSAGAIYVNNDAAVTLTATQTVSGKSISGSTNTLTAIPLSAFTNLGTTTTVLHGNASGSPTFGAVNLSSDVTGNLPVANLNSGTNASASTVWRGDGVWAAPPAASLSTFSGLLPTGTSQTYTTPVGARQLEVTMCGAGAGGAGAGTTAPVNGTAGSDAVFNGIHASGGVPGNLGQGASPSPGSGTTNVVDRQVGNPGSPGLNETGDGNAGNGGASPRGGAGAGSVSQSGNPQAGKAAAANSCSGGGGGWYNSAGYAGQGGSAGETVFLVIPSPAPTYTYTEPATGGAGGVDPTNANNGGAGGGAAITIKVDY